MNVQNSVRSFISIAVSAVLSEREFADLIPDDLQLFTLPAYLRQDPLEAILLIIGHSSLISFFFLFVWKPFVKQGCTTRCTQLPPSFPTIPQQCHENFVTLLWNCWKRGRELSTSCRTSLFNKMSFNLPSARKIILFESSWKNMKNDTTFVRMRSGDHLGARTACESDAPTIVRTGGLDTTMMTFWWEFLGKRRGLTKVFPITKPWSRQELQCRQFKDYPSAGEQRFWRWTMSVSITAFWLTDLLFRSNMSKWPQRTGERRVYLYSLMAERRTKTSKESWKPSAQWWDRSPTNTTSTKAIVSMPVSGM